MASDKIKLALLSPQFEGETFIMAHKQLLPFDICHYYGGRIPKFSEQEGPLIEPGMKDWIKVKSRNAFFLNDYGLSTLEKAVAKSFKKNKIEVVLAEYGTTGASMVNVCKALGLPLIVYFFGYDAWVKDILEYYSVAYKKLFSYAHTIFAVSKSIQRQLICLGCAPEKIIYSACGPRDDFFKINGSGNENIVLSTGRFINKKAPYYIILAFKKVVEQIPTAKLVMCGEGPLFETCSNLVKYAGIQSNILLTGNINQQQSMEYLSCSSVFVQHSITGVNGDMEGTPVAILEACAAGLPVVSTIHSGIPEIIEHTVTGLLVAEHDVEGMAAEIIYLLTYKDAAKAMGNAGRVRVQKYFSMQQHISTVTCAIEAAYESRTEKAGT